MTIELKRRAAERAVDHIVDGMVVGLGSGSTASEAVRTLGERLISRELRRVVGVPTSRTTEELALDSAIPLTTLGERPQLDLTIDGADDIDDNLNLIKGLGGALVREKIVAVCSRQLIIVADHTKLSPRLGMRTPLPIEVVQFGWQTQVQFLESLGAKATLRMATVDRAFVSDNDNFILDAWFPAGLPKELDQLTDLQRTLDARPGVVGHGLFIGMTSLACIASPEGVVVLSSPR